MSNLKKREEPGVGKQWLTELNCSFWHVRDRHVPQEDSAHLKVKEALNADCQRTLASAPSQQKVRDSRYRTGQGVGWFGGVLCARLWEGSRGSESNVKDRRQR